MDADELKHKIPAELRSKIAQAAENPTAFSVGFKSAVALLIVCSIVITCTACYFVFSGENRSESRFNKDAGVLCSRLISEYGSSKTEPMDTDGTYRLTGLSFVRSVDFNGDGHSELLLAFRNSNAYQVEVWGYDSDEFRNFYSQPANSSAGAPEAGYWITLYRHSGKTYLGSFSKEDQKTMELLSLHGSEFRATDECDYDAEKDIYAVDGEINTADFETIRLSNLTAVKAETVLDSVSAAMEDYSQSGEVQTQAVAAKSPQQLMNEAYYTILENYTRQYGEASYESGSRICYADGLCVVDLIDFNADGTDELLTVYRYNKKVSGKDKNGNYEMETEPEYKLEIHSWNGSAAQKIYENDGVSEMQDGASSDRFYILRLRGDKTDICKNTYTYDKNTSRIWKGTSRISEMTDDGKFESAFIAEVSSNYGYLTYRIDGERVYRREFNEKGYAVPYFCNDDEYDDSEFSVIYLQGDSKRGSDINKLISNTQSTMETIRSATLV